MTFLSFNNNMILKSHPEAKIHSVILILQQRNLKSGRSMCS